MIHFIKMDVYRLLHSVSTWIMMGIMAVIAVFYVWATSSDLSAMAEDPSYLEPQAAVEEDSGVQYGIIMETDPAWINGDIPSGQLLGLLLNSSILMIFCAVFVSLFVGAEHRSGYLKNIAGQLPGCGLLALSKFTAIAVEVLLMFVLYAVFYTLAGFAFFGSRFVPGSGTELFKMLGTQYLLHLGYSALILSLCMATGSSAFSIAVGILGCSGLTTVLYSGISWGIHKINNSIDFDFGHYMLDTNVYAVSGSSPSHDIRTPLTALDGYFQLLKQSSSEGERRRYTAVIQSRITSLTAMLEELFTYTRLQNNEYELPIKRLDFSHCVCNTLFAFYYTDFKSAGKFIFQLKRHSPTGTRGLVPRLFPMGAIF